MNYSTHQEVAATYFDSCERSYDDSVNAFEQSINDFYSGKNEEQVLRERISEDQSLKGKIVINLLVNAVFLIWGFIVFVELKIPEGSALLFMIGGLPTAWRMTKFLGRTSKNHVKEQYVNTSFLMFFLRFFLSVLIAGVTSPLLLIINTVKLFRCEKRINKYEAQLKNISESNNFPV